MKFHCESCGILVVQMIPEPEAILCAKCRFIERIEDPSDRAEMLKHLQWKDKQ